jgi:hypothetical protein
MFQTVNCYILCLQTVNALPILCADYDSSQCLHYTRLPSYDNFVLTGPNTQLQPSVEEDSDEEQVQCAFVCFFYTSALVGHLFSLCLPIWS